MFPRKRYETRFPGILIKEMKLADKRRSDEGIFACLIYGRIQMCWPRPTMARPLARKGPCDPASRFLYELQGTAGCCNV